MADRIKNNPFTQLFGSCEAAENYSKLRHEQLEQDTNLNLSENSDCAEYVRAVTRTDDVPTVVFPPKNECKVIKVSDLIKNNDQLETEGSFSYVFETAEELDYALKQFSSTHNIHDEPPTTSGEINNENETADSIKNYTDCSVPISTELNDTPNLTHSDKDEDVSKSEINKIIEEVFCFTLNKDQNIERDSYVLYLEDFQPQVVIDVELLEQVLFERLLLDDPSKNLIHTIHKESNLESTHAAEKEVLTYLFECYKRLQVAETTYLTKVNEISEMKNLVIRNSATALKQPDLFESQILHYQVIKLFSDSDLYFDQLVKYFDLIVKECVKDENDPMDILNNAFCSTLDYVHREIVNSTLFSVNRSYMKLIQLFSCNNYLGSVMLQHSTPKNSTYGKSYADTLLGAVLSLSVLPKSHHDQFNAIGDPFQMSSATESLIWSSLQFITDIVHVIFYNLLKTSPEVKSKALQWIAGCLHSNSARGKLWSSHGFSMGSPYCVSDGFMLNLSSVLLHLCQPICANPKDLKICRIDPTYCAVNTKNAEEANSKGVHMKGLDSETCLIPSAEGNSTRPFATSYNFITECFFMAHRSLDLGFRVVLEQLLRLNQDIVQIQRAYNDAQNQAGAHSEVVEDIKDRLEMEMIKYLSIRAALMEPQTLSMMAQFHLATSVWLVQVAVDVEQQEERTSFMPSKLRQVEFPLSVVVPQTLSCIPEFLIENTVGFLSFLRRFNPETLEQQGFEFLDPILTEVLVFMGSPERMHNPHLRARMAECLESLLPYHKDDNPMRNNKPYGSFFRERLFKEHCHRDQLVRSLLAVFVGIEMTGQSVAFEQKFNYRSPMYIVMDYLWQIEEHKQAFKLLAEEAEANMEAITPPLFLRFINLLMNDAVFLLDDALSNMAQLRVMQNARESGEWLQLPANERDQNEGFLRHTGMIARFDNILGRETIHILEILTSEITSIFTHPTLVDRISAMLNYFLCHLVGPKKKNFKVKDQKEYEFDPANIVMNICKIYVHLHKSDAFCVAVSGDGRSYSPQLFQLAEDVLVRIGGGGLVTDLQAVAAKVAEIGMKQQGEEEILGDIPDEFLDPIMSTLMTDPVKLPSSKITIDRSTIARHLLSDQTDPFNRSPLTMDMVKSDEELRSRIDDWVRERKQTGGNQQQQTSSQ